MLLAYQDMIFDVCNLCNKLSVSLPMIWTCPVGQFFCKSWLPKPKIDCPRQSGNLIVAPCKQRMIITIYDGYHHNQ